MSLEANVGSQLVFGIPGTQATPEILQHFKDTNAGGLILFRRNFESPEQLRKLISDFDNALGRRILVCVDHEGGRVIMFNSGITVFPSNQAIGKTGNSQYARFQGEQEAKELRRLGVDVNFAPVIDVLTEAYSPNIGIRSYGSDPSVVSNMGAARLSAMQVEGLSACAKHFPGLGAATLDPHISLPTVDLSWEEMEKIHLVPFYRAMRTAVQSIMTSHVLYPKLDSAPSTPATFSKKIVREYLRQKTGYKGVVFTDDLEMGALKNLCPIGEAAVRAAEAGHDMFLVCHTLSTQKEVYQSLVSAYQSGRLIQKDLEDSLKRIELLKGKRQERFAALPATELRAQKERDDAQAIVKKICAESVTVMQKGTAPVPNQSVAVIFPRVSSVADKVMVEQPLHDESAFMQSCLKEVGASGTSCIVDLEPSAAQIEKAAAAAQQAAYVLLFLYDAGIHDSNRQLLEAVQKSGKPLSIVFLRDVYDQRWVSASAQTVSNYGYRVCDIQAAFKTLYTPAEVSAHS